MINVIKSVWKRASKVLPDWLYISLEYKLHIGHFPDLNNPLTFNEKLQWLKLHDRKSKYTMMVDKYAVKAYIADKIGEQFVIPTIGAWDRFEDIDFDKLPNKFVLKCTHDSGGTYICRDKSKFDKSLARKKLSNSLKNNFYYSGREWPYKNVTPRIIAEQYMEEPHNTELRDYKLMCFNGKVRCTFVCTDRSKGLKVTFLDNEWKKLPFERHYPASQSDIPKPSQFEKMKELAEKLAEGIPFVRVDFYEISGKIYFGELTFYPGGGFEEFNPEKWDRILGDWLILPEI